MLVTDEMLRGMRPGSVVVDLAAEQGGNCEASQPGREVGGHGARVLAPLSLATTIPYHASQLYAKNLANFVLNMTKQGELAARVERGRDRPRQQADARRARSWRRACARRSGCSPLPAPAPVRCLRRRARRERHPRPAIIRALESAPHAQLCPSRTPPRTRLEDLLARPDAEVGLAEAALLIAAQEYDGLDVRAYLVRLDEMGRALRARLEDEPRPERAVMALNHYLFQELGFRGNTEQYYDARNSYLNEVLDRRTGIPITLSLVYIEVARRGGLEVEGVGLPGPLRRAGADARARPAVDPFHGGDAALREGLPGAARPHLQRQGQARAQDARGPAGARRCSSACSAT